MPLLSGDELDAQSYFSQGQPRARASSFDLSIGAIFDHNGKEIRVPFLLQPGHMVQVVSAETFRLPADVTGHVTYKTDLTKKGIWALTVGIVDPGWTGPVTTTLLNFSRIDFVVRPGAPFLRVSLFKHQRVSDTKLLPESVSIPNYMDDAREAAMTKFAPTFLNKDEIEAKATSHVLRKMRGEALAWVALIAIVFTLIDFGSSAFHTWFIDYTDQAGSLRSKVEQLSRELHHSPSDTPSSTDREVDHLRDEVQQLKAQLHDLDITRKSPTPPSSPAQPPR